MTDRHQKSTLSRRGLTASLIGIASLWATLPAAATPDPIKTNNVIFFITDGMGPEYTSAYRYFLDETKKAPIKTTIFDQTLVGMASTYSAGDRKDHHTMTYVTDSAAAATALSSGIKTYNHAVAVDVDQKPVQTLMEYAKSLGKTTGLVVTSQINHATPASFVAHENSRYDYNRIADDYFDNRVDGQWTADLMFGGGQQFFVRPDRNIAAQFSQAGYQYIDDFKRLGEFNRLPALGLFAPVDLGFAIDSSEKYRLTTMVSKALDLMTNDGKGYFLLIEASLIDWCGHSNDIGCAMHEVDDAAHTLTFLQAYVAQHPDTLVVVTADHSTGGLTIGSNDHYQFKPAAIRAIKQSIKMAYQHILKLDDPLKAWQQSINLPLDTAQQQRLSGGYAALKKVLASQVDQKTKDAASDRFDDVLTQLISELTFAGWTTHAHTGGDVQIFAIGQDKHRFSGHLDNTQIAKTLFSILSTATQVGAKAAKTN